MSPLPLRIYFRLLSIACRRYAADPASREASARMMLTSSLRIARAELGDREAAELALLVLSGEAMRDAA